MVLVARTPEIDRVCGGSVMAVLDDFARQLTGLSETRQIVVTNLFPHHLADTDVIVFAARVDALGLEITARQALAAWSQSRFLAGKVAFCVLIGDGPADFGPHYEAVAEAVSATGATAFAPAFTLVNGQPDLHLAVEKFCNYWATVMPSLRHIASTDSSENRAA